MSARNRSRADARESQLQSEERQAGKTSTDLLRQACRDANASIEIGNDTTQRLGAQGEQMDRMGRQLDNIEYELKVSDRIVKNISSWGGMVASWFSSTPSAPKEAQNQTSRHVQAVGQTGKPPGLLPRKKDAVSESPLVVNEEDRLLDSLSNDLQVLKGQATLHRDVLDEHNKKLEKLVDKNDRVMAHMQKTDRNVRKLL